MTKDPAFLFYSKDWLEGTAHMMPDEKGVYIDLLAHQHQRGILPSDLNRLARLTGLSFKKFTRIWENIKDKFEQEENQIINVKLNCIIMERKMIAKKNKFIGTFGYVLKKLNLKKSIENEIRKQFNVNKLMSEYNGEWDSERCMLWCQNAIALIGNGDENVIINIKEVNNIYIEVIKFFPENIIPKNSNDWLIELDKLIRIDKRKPEEIIKVIKWARQDDFWSSNFLSILKLRKKNKQGIKYYDVFFNKMKGLKPNKNPHSDFDDR